MQISKILGVIPARSGSKGVPNKNIKMLAGKPLMCWTIDAALKSGIFSDIIVSTDSEKYAKIAKESGACVPFLRPKELASDQSSTMDVIRHLIAKLLESGKSYEYLAILQPTSPLRKADDIQKSLYELQQKRATSIISVCETEHSPFWMNTLPDDHLMENFLRPENNNVPRQKLNKWYRLNGAIYISKVDVLLKNGSFYGPQSYAFIMSQGSSIDIDSELDFEIADFLLKRRISKGDEC